MKRKIYLHIGTEKTATTYLQSWFDENEGILKRKGLIYPSKAYGPRHDFIYQLISDELNVGSLGYNSKINLAKDFNVFKELSKIDSDILLSNEHLSSRLYKLEHILDLKKVLEATEREVEVIIYFRNPVNFLISSYVECCKDMETKCFDEFLDDIVNDSHEFEYLNFKNRFDYHNILKKWQDVFEKVHAFDFDSISKTNHGILPHLVDVVGVKESYIDCSITKGKNASLGVFSTFLLRKLNPIFKLLMLNRNKSNYLWIIGKKSKALIVKVLTVIDKSHRLNSSNVVLTKFNKHIERVGTIRFYEKLRDNDE